MTYKHMRTLTLIVCMFLLVSCIPHKKIEDLGIITTRGTDAIEDDRIRSTFIIFEFNPEKTSSRVLTGDGKTLKGARINANAASNFELAPSKIQLELYGSKLAQKGLSPYLDLLGRDSNIPDTMYLSISKTTANDILMLQNKGGFIEDIGRFLHDVIEESSTQEVFPKVTFSTFFTTLFDTGVDPILPVFEVIDDTPKITAIALFQDDQYIGDLPMEDKILLNLLEAKIREQLFDVSLPFKPFAKYLVGKKSENKELNTSFRILKGKAKSTLINKDEVSFKTDIKLDIDLLELSEQISIKEPDAIKLLETEVEKVLTKRYQKMLEQLKEINTDPIGYGAIYRAKDKNSALTNEKWRELFPDIKVEYNIKVKIKHHGEHF